MFEKAKLGVTKAFDIPEETILGIPYLTLTGNSSVLIENYKGTTYIVEYYWSSNSDHVVYRYKEPDGEWSRCYARNVYTSDSAQCLVFRDAWYVIKGYPFS